MQHKNRVVGEINGGIGPETASGMPPMLTIGRYANELDVCQRKESAAAEITNYNKDQGYCNIGGMDLKLGKLGRCQLLNASLTISQPRMCFIPMTY